MWLIQVNFQIEKKPNVSYQLCVGFQSVAGILGLRHVDERDLDAHPCGHLAEVPAIRCPIEEISLTNYFKKSIKRFIKNNLY